MTRILGSGVRAERSHFGLADIWEENAHLELLSRGGRAWQLFREALRGLAAAPLSTVLAVATIAVTFYIMAAFLIGIQTVAAFISSARAELTLTLYLQDEVTEAAVNSLLDELAGWDTIQSVLYTDPATALKELQRQLGAQAEVLAGLEEQNPLPAALDLQFKAEVVSPEAFAEFAAQFEKRAEVAQVQYSRGVLGQFGALLGFFRRVGLMAVLLLLVTTVFIVLSTVRLALYSRNEEIAIMRLVGADRSFVTVPCLIEGGLQGWAGAALGVLALKPSCTALNNVIAGDAAIAALLPPVVFFAWWVVVVILAVGLLVGLAGSFWAVRRFSSI